MEIPELSKAIASISTRSICCPERFAVESCGRGALDRVSAVTCCAPFLYSLQMTIAGVSCGLQSRWCFANRFLEDTLQWLMIRFYSDI